MNTVKIRNIEVGEGMPKIIVPIVGRSREEIVSRGKELAGMDLDMVEWRADFYDDVFDTEKVLETLKELREALGEKALLFTFRTKKEGGEKAMDADAYTEMNAAVAGSGNADALDVEIFSGDDVVRRNIDAIHTAGKVVIGSNHDFFKTPSKADLIYRLRKMQDMEADIPKIAVMPQNKEDVLTLLSATEEMKNYADRPIITMSMSATGVISRLCGEVFGSSMTFGTVGAASAPGQIPVGQLRESMEILHSAL